MVDWPAATSMIDAQTTQKSNVWVGTWKNGWTPYTTILKTISSAKKPVITALAHSVTVYL